MGELCVSVAIIAGIAAAVGARALADIATEWANGGGGAAAMRSKPRTRRATRRTRERVEALEKSAGELQARCRAGRRRVREPP